MKIKNSNNGKNKLLKDLNQIISQNYNSKKYDANKQ